MGKQVLAGMFLLLGMGSPSLALDSPPTPVETATVAKPAVLQAKERIPDNTHHSLPRPPRQYIDGTRLNLDNEENEAPQGAPMRILAGPSVIQQVPSVNKEDRQSGKYFWHPYEGWNFCHYREGDRDWYGWRTGETFHWVLWQSGHFWWRDDYAERWLYFDQGYWWWQGPGKTPEFQVYLEDGHYHKCGANGVLGEDMMKTGTEEVVTEPVSKSDLDSSSGKDKETENPPAPKGFGSGMGGIR